MSFVQYSPFRDAVINPTDFIKPVPHFPKVVVATFSHAIVDKFARHYGDRVIAHTATANGPVPIHSVAYGGAEFALFLSPVGAPAAACIMEEVIAMGARGFVYFGSCGVLERGIVEGHFVVPTAAVRDEGTSHHYLPAAQEIALPQKGVAAVTDALGSAGFPYIEAKTWTTDGIYRETRDKVRQRKKQGCAVVEMECAALAAVAAFREVAFAQFLFADDNLDAPQWEPRTLGENGMAHSDRYMAAALECGLRLLEG